MLHLLLAAAVLGTAPSPDPVAQVTSRELARTSAPAADTEIQLGLDEYWRLRFREAERHFQAAVNADPESAAAHYYLAYTVYKIAEPKRPDDPGKHRAHELFAKAYALDPLFVPTWR